MNYQTSARTPSPTVHLVPGIHTSDPYENIGKLKVYFHDAGFEDVVVHSYGFLLFFLARFKNPGIAERMKKFVKPGDIIVGYSNGALIGKMIADDGIRLGGLVLINPAIDQDVRFPKNVPWIHVYYNDGDDMVALSSILPFHPWGDMGRVGYRGPWDGRVRKFNFGRGVPKTDGHSDIFDGREDVHIRGPQISSNARRAWEKDAKIAALPPLP